ncbi:unnamed protein product [Fusarium fujikuroi]|nr:unnamed protein product [Fusarium fujikuroi]
MLICPSITLIYIIAINFITNLLLVPFTKITYIKVHFYILAKAIRDIIFLANLLKIISIKYLIPTHANNYINKANQSIRIAIKLTLSLNRRYKNKKEILYPLKDFLYNKKARVLNTITQSNYSNSPNDLIG